MVGLGDVGGPDVVDWGLDGAIVRAVEACLAVSVGRHYCVQLLD